MNNEKILNAAFEIARNSYPEFYDNFKNNWNTYRASFAKTELPVLYHCATMIAEALEDMDKKSTKPSKLTAAKRIVSNCSRESLRGTWSDADGRTCICDGFRAVRVSDSFASLPTVPEWREMPRIFKNPMEYTRVVELPTVAALKKSAAEQRAAGGRSCTPAYDFGDDLPKVSCDYLLDMLALLPGCVAYVANRCATTSPLYFKADNGDGILMPVRK